MSHLPFQQASVSEVLPPSLHTHYIELPFRYRPRDAAQEKQNADSAENGNKREGLRAYKLMAKETDK